MKKIVAAMMLMTAVFAVETSAGTDAAALLDVVDTIKGDGALNVVTYAAPAALPLKELGLREAGLVDAEFFQKADEIRIFTERTKMNESPKARIWINRKEGAKYWFHTGGSGSAEEYVIQPGEVIVVVARALSLELRWQNPWASR